MDYIVVFNESRVQRFKDQDEFEGATFDLESGEDYKVFLTADVLAAIKESNLEPSNKQSLIRKIKYGEDDFELTQELDEVLGNVDEEIEF